MSKEETEQGESKTVFAKTVCKVIQLDTNNPENCLSEIKFL